MISHLRVAQLLSAFVLPLSGGLLAQTAAPGFVNTLMPQPSHIEAHAGALRIDSSFGYTLLGDSGPRISGAAARFVARLETRTGISLPQAPAAAGQPATLAINVTTPTEKAFPQPGDDESYALTINDHSVTLNAKTDIGALRGLETLLQLVEPSGNGYIFPAVSIEDAPRFPWRGLLLDPGRHFLPTPVILRTLDGMAAVKLNVLHWHLTEDQGFRIESKAYPKLTTLGSNGQFYTQDEVRAVVAYASARGIRVVPEFDMPGHSQSWMVGYPELGSAPGPYSIATRYGILDAAMDPTRESTYQFIDTFLGEMTGLFPDPYLHIGGDESNGKQWRANAAIQAFMTEHGMKTTAELQGYFNTRLQKLLADHHRQMVGWDEILSPTLPRDAVIQNWHGSEFLINSAKQGHRVMLSSPYYLDHMRSAGEMFLADPIPEGSGLTADEAKLILGGEACMWGEHVVPATIDSRIWPRAAAIAERFWSPAADRDVDDMYRRLAAETVRLEAEGVTQLSGPGRILRDLAGTAQIEPLELFAATLQPVDFHVRYREQHTSPATVFDRLIDGVRPDPPLRHEMPLLVDAALRGDTAAMDRLDALFHAWVAAAPAVEALAAGSPLLAEASAHIAAWPKLGSMGIEALSYLRSGQAPPAGWHDAQLATLHAADQPHELVDFVVLAPIEKLVEGASKGR